MKKVKVLKRDVIEMIGNGNNIGPTEWGKLNLGWFPGFRIGLKQMGAIIRD